MSSRPSQEAGITALLIAPNRQLAQQLLATLPQTGAFQVLADLKSYPPHQTLDIRCRQLKPNVILLDLSTDLNAAVELIKWVTQLNPPVHVVGLHTVNDSQVILQSLRAGASEFLFTPFDAAQQREAIARLRRLVVPEPTAETEEGHAVAFTSPKPGSGASTIATQTAFSLERLTGKRVLLADCDLTGGTIGFYLKLSHNYSLLDALQHAEHLDPALWNSLTVNYGGLDILPAPAAPYAEPLDSTRLRMLVDQARHVYDWVVLDLPTVFSRTSLIAISECERAYLISTSELPSLHLTRKALTMLDTLGFPKDRFHIVVNRVAKRDRMGLEHIERLFETKVHARLPNDYFSLHRVVTLGQPLGAEGELGAAIENVAMRLSGGAAEKKGAGGRGYKPALQQA